MILKPESAPTAGTIIGGPTLTDFEPLIPAEIHKNLRLPIETALKHGADPMQNTFIPIFIMCRLIRTLDHLVSDNASMIQFLVWLKEEGRLEGEELEKKMESIAPLVEMAQLSKTDIHDTLRSIFTEDDQT